MKTRWEEGRGLGEHRDDVPEWKFWERFQQKEKMVLQKHYLEKPMSLESYLETFGWRGMVRGSGVGTESRVSERLSKQFNSINTVIQNT